ncbi:MarR family transcriptional regulator, partial [Streptomyces sp. NPDC054835]
MTRPALTSQGRSQPAGRAVGVPPQPPGRDPSAAAPASQQGMRRQNLAVVIGAVAAHGPLSRADVAGRTGLTRPAVSSMVDELIGRGALTETETAPSGR